MAQGNSEEVKDRLSDKIQKLQLFLPILQRDKKFHETRCVETQGDIKDLVEDIER